jgi:SAM-dependent methyltransferase
MNQDPGDLAAYYTARAGTYEQEVYGRPERQADLAVLKERVREAVHGQRVLEIACGTGYWTGLLAQSAAAVLATEINPAMIEVAQAKALPADKVGFALANAFDLQIEEGAFPVCFAAFWWSHVQRQDQAGFLARLRSKLGKDTLLILMDDVYVEAGNEPIARTDLEGNTYQIHTLASGGRHEVLKNFPTDSALRKKMGPHVKDIRIARLEHYWMLTGRLK